MTNLCQFVDPSDYKSRAKEIIALACKDAAAKLLRQHDHVQNLWSEANSIPSGCGGTPFRSDARRSEEQLSKAVAKFKSRYGAAELKKLCLFYGVRR